MPGTIVSALSNRFRTMEISVELGEQTNSSGAISSALKTTANSTSTLTNHPGVNGRSTVPTGKTQLTVASSTLTTSNSVTNASSVTGQSGTTVRQRLLQNLRTLKDQIEISVHRKDGKNSGERTRANEAINTFLKGTLHKTGLTEGVMYNILGKLKYYSLAEQFNIDKAAFSRTVAETVRDYILEYEQPDGKTSRAGKDMIAGALQAGFPLDPLKEVGGEEVRERLG